MIYANPKDVLSPTEFIDKVIPFYDGGDSSYSLAKITWEGKECVGIRWNVARREWDNRLKNTLQKACVGMPSSHGRPVWFILPDDIVNRLQSILRS